MPFPKEPTSTSSFQLSPATTVPWVILATMAVITSIGANELLARLVLRRVGKEGDEANEDDGPTTSSTIQFQRFPWEPAAQTTTQSDVAAETSPNRMSTDHQNRQLELLASMTFANGGFRPPSCPCCQ